MASSMYWRSRCTTYSHICFCSPLIFKKPSVNLPTQFIKNAKQFNARASIRLSNPTSTGRLQHQIVESDHWRTMASVSEASKSLASDNMDEQTNFWQQVEGHQKMAAKLPAVERVRTLIHSSSSGILSTFSQKYDGYPSGSIVDFASSEDGCPILAVSSLAVHTKDLLANSKCSLLVTKDPADRTDLIVTLHGDASLVAEDQQESSWACYLRKHPGAFWVDFGDFQFVRIEPKCVRYVSGIATAMLESGDFTEEEYKSAQVDPISQFSVPVASHMNRDHAEDTKLIVQHSTAIQVDYAHIIDLDRLGFNVKVGYHGNTVKLRIPFPRPAEDRRDVKTLIVQMLEAAKESSTK
ncbi:hypothetical protein SUGI_0434320 [Cryptomeria japonica]|uniref:glutamyl-tRNA reductase-binding protein, chloroplastic isoform X2 n=1 Tax=Cryptomeria japonica TaxID=3369 RepID=UPI002408970A|nr:glutamyl-tRNA reductase-binding protein, chloroplastic isoform X2 [Cryptomeria japonica]GLJ23015.1 hypothetical protein SUGI_0434320 [Cryptomeria japonica]